MKIASTDLFQEFNSWLNSKTCKELRSLQESDRDMGFYCIESGLNNLTSSL